MRVRGPDEVITDDFFFVSGLGQTFLSPVHDLYKLADLRLRFLASELLQNFWRQVVLEIALDVEGFPPAIDYFPAGMPLWLTGFTIEKIDRAPESGAPSHELFCCFAHHRSGCVINLSAFDMLRLRILGQNTGISVLLFLTERQVLQLPGKVFIVGAQVDQAVTAPVE